MNIIEELESFEISQEIYGVIEKTLVEETKMVPEMLKIWTETITRDVFDELMKLEKSLKFIVTCNINQKLGSLFLTHSTGFINKETDTVKTFRWENVAMYCVVSVYAFGLE